MARRPCVHAGSSGDGFIEDCGVLHDSVGDGVTGQASDVVNVQSVHHLLAMFFDCLDADEQFGGDLFVAVAFGDQLEHFPFTWSEVTTALPGGFAFESGLLPLVEHPLGDGRAEEGFAFVGLPNRHRQVLSGGLFDEVASGAGLGQLLHILIIVVGGEDDDFRFGILDADLTSGLESSPFSAGMAMSMTTTSGCKRLTICSA